MKALLSFEGVAKERGYSLRSIHRIVREMGIDLVKFPMRHGGRGVKSFLRREDVARIPMNPRRAA